MRSTRRSRLALTAVTALSAGLLVGCATDAPAEQGGGSDLIPAAEGKVDYPVTLQTSWGEVTIDERPERVVAGSWRGELSWLLALGVTPVAVESVEWAMDAVPWAEENLAQPIEHTWTYDDLAMEHEAIAAATPDLIFAGAQGAEPVPNLEQLSAVAPVLAQPDTGEEYAGWRDNILLLGEALDLQDRAQQVVAEYDAFFEAFQGEHPEFADTTISFVGFHGQNEVWYGNAPGTQIEEFFARMGFAANPGALPDDEALSPELIGQISGDVLVIVDYSPAEDEAREFTALIESDLFQSIDAVQNGDVVYLASPERTALFQDGVELGPIAHPSVAYDDPIGSPRLADLLAPVIAETLAD